MNAAHIHLVLNHFPLLATLFGFFFQLFGFLLKKEPYQRAGLVLYLVAAVMIVPTYLSGEAAESVIEGLPGVKLSYHEEHDEAAEKAMVAVITLGVLSLVSLVVGWKKGELPKWSAPLGLGLAAISIGLLVWTANLGGKIHHQEVRSDFQPVEKEGSHEHEHEH